MREEYIKIQADPINGITKDIDDDALIVDRFIDFYQSLPLLDKAICCTVTRKQLRALERSYGIQFNF